MKKWVLVQDKNTGSVVACEKEHAKELQRDGEKKIIAEKGEKEFDRLSKLKVDGKI